MDYGVIDNITGQPVRTGLTEEKAVYLCHGLNLAAGPGGRYGVRPPDAPAPCPAGKTGGRHAPVTVTFYPCDAVSILRALREVADAETLRIVAQAELAR